MNYNFYLPKIETRTSQLKQGIKKYIIKGYATVPNHIYSYGGTQDKEGKIIKNFREYFTTKGLENLRNKAKKQNVFVDVGHNVAGSINIPKVLEQISQRTGADLSEEKDYILKRLKDADIPMFKVENLDIDDKGLFVEIAGNPFYRDADPERAAYFDAVWNSLDNWFINGMSLNFRPTEVVPINDEVNQIDNVDLFGISLVSGAANDMANITEVATRCMNEFRRESECQKKIQTTSLIL